MMVGVQPVGIGSVDDGGAVTRSELLDDIETTLDEVVKESPCEEIMEAVIAELSGKDAKPELVVRLTVEVISKLKAEAGTEAAELVVRLIEDAISELKAEAGSEKAELILGTDDTVASGLEARAVNVEPTLGRDADDDMDSKSLAGTEGCARLECELTMADTNAAEVELIAGVSDETADAVVEVVLRLTRTELEMTEVSGFIAKSPMDSPASAWRLKRRSRDPAVGGQVTTSLSAGDVLLNAAYEAKYCFHSVGMLSPLVPILSTPMRISTEHRPTAELDLSHTLTI
jgi:hypothetical protein